LGDRNRHEKFEALYAAHVKDLLSYALRRSASTHDAVETLSEAMLVAWRRIDDVPEGIEARLWLFGVMRNVMNNSRRSSRRQKRLIEKVSSLLEADVHEETRSRDTRTSNVHEALKQLRPIEAEVIRLSIWEELTSSQISTLLQIPPETVRTHLHRGRLKLRGLLGHTDISDVEVRGEACERDE
jgi:RNA polymerase sigma factor (sigma-70 family)